VDVTIFEIGSHIGGLWVYDNDNGRSSAYRSLHINSEARGSSFRDFPFPPDEPYYPDHVRMKRYFEDYAERFDLKRRIRFNSPVVNVEQRAGGLGVRLGRGVGGGFCARGWRCGSRAASRRCSTAWSRRAGTRVIRGTRRS